jgi:DNA-binding transcriptional LysR family regulator
VLVGEDAFHVLLRTDHPLGGVAEAHVADLTDDPFLFSCGGCERHVRQVHSGLPFDPLHRVRELGALPAMVRAGIGISIVPGLVASMLVHGPALVPLRPRVVRKLVTSGPPGREWHPAVRAVVDSLPGV